MKLIKGSKITGVILVCNNLLPIEYDEGNCFRVGIVCTDKVYNMDEMIC